MSKRIQIQDRSIGPGCSPFIIAELSGNHNGDIRRALAIVDAAKQAGADAIKIQTYTPETMTLDSELEDFRIKEGTWKGYKLFDLYREAQTPWSWHEEIIGHARKLGLIAFSTPFDETAVDFLEQLGVPAYKIASFELVDHELIARVARTGKPLIMSTGMGSLAEIDEAVTTARVNGAIDLVLLHCVSAYPAPPDDANLMTIRHLADTFHAVGGLSDHTLGTSVAVAAVALGAHVIEKHVTARRSDGGPDAAFSLEPDELARMVADCRAAAAARGEVSYAREASEASNVVFRRSLYVVRDVVEGEPFRRDNVRAIRPGYGLAPKHLPHVLGKRARRTLPRGTALTWDVIG